LHDVAGIALCDDETAIEAVGRRRHCVRTGVDERIWRDDGVVSGVIAADVAGWTGCECLGTDRVAHCGRLLGLVVVFDGGFRM
jgi:hypothetical protein